MCQSIIPTHQHDCDICTFLGKVVYRGQIFDLYHCTSDPGYIARFGEDGDYIFAKDGHADSYSVDHPIAQAVVLFLAQ